MENHSSIGFFVVAVKNLCDTTWNFECFIFVVYQYWQHTWLYKIITTEMLLILDVMKNANHSLLDSIPCSKLSTHVSDCSLSSLEQFLIQIPRYTLFTYSIDNGFKLLPGRVNFIIVLYHSLYVTLIAFMTDIVSIIQQA